MINLEARIMRLEEQTQRMGFSETSMDEGGAFWRRGDDGDERQGWNGTWWIRVEQQDLNSRQKKEDIQETSEDDNSGKERDGQSSQRTTKR